MALGAQEAAFSIFSSFSSTSSKLPASFDKPLSSLRFQNPHHAASSSLKFTLHSLPLHSSSPPTKKHGFQLHSSVESAAVDENATVEESATVEELQKVKIESRRKLFVQNLPWSYSVVDIKKLFGECGPVDGVEIIKHKDGKNRGFAFVTMASGEGAQAAVEKYDSYELVGRIIRVQFARRFKKPIRNVPESPPRRETRHKLYVSNLAWKARSNNLRELFSSNFNPVSCRVVFETPEKSAGYGFVSFETKEEAESAIKELHGKELLGRPINLKFSERSSDFASESKEEEPASEGKEEQIASESKEEESSQEKPEGR